MIINLILACLAVFRAAEMIAVDDGPFDIFANIRILVGCYDFNETGRAKTNLGRLLGCPYCVGVWLAFIAALIIAPFDFHLPLYWFAIAGGQAFIQTIGGRK